MAQTGFIINFRNNLERYKSLDLKRFYRDHLGINSLRRCEPILKEILEKASRAEKFVEKLPDNHVNNLTNVLNNTILEIEKTYAYDDNTMLTLVQDTQNKLNAQLNNVLNNIWPQILAIINDRPELTEVIKETSESLKKAREHEVKIEELKEKLETKLESFEILVDSASGQLQINKQSDEFINLARKNIKSAYWWLSAGVVIMGTLLIYTFILSGENAWQILKPVCLNKALALKDVQSLLISQQPAMFCSEYDSYIFWLTVLKTIFYRGIFIGLLIYGFIFSIKNFDALMHNYIINSQRGNSLGSALILLSKIVDDGGKKDIINNSLSNIMAHQETGYTKSLDIKNSIGMFEKLIEMFSKLKN